MSGTAANSGAITVDKSITIDGAGYALNATNGSQNATLLLVANGANATIQNLTVNGNGCAKHGVQAYSATAILNDVTSTGNTGYGILVNRSTVEATGLTTSGNGWGGVNVDANGSGSASFTMNSGSIAEDASVVIEGDAGDTTETTINGGTLQNVMKHPNAADAAGEDTITISGGTISGSVTGDIVKVEAGQIKGDVTGNQSLEVNGGTIGGTVSPVYQATYAMGENVEVTGLGGSYAQGQTVTFTATADGGYTLDADSVKAQTDGGTDVAVTDNEDGSFSFTMPAENVSVTVTATAQPGTHTVTFMNGNNVAGTITVTDGDTITKADAPTLTPDAGYVFEGWFSGVGATGERLGEAPVTVNADLVYYASFYSDNYTVHRNDTDIIEVTEVNGQPAGPTVTSQPQNDYLASTGDTVEYTVTPETGRKVANSVVKDEAGNAVDIRTLDIDENGKITYQFTIYAFSSRLRSSGW